MPVEPYFFRVDAKKILKELQPFLESKAFYEVYPGYGGWSITSSTGSSREGWNWEAVVIDPATKRMDMEKTRKNFSKMGLKTDAEHVLPTELCTPSMREIIERFQELGLKPCRVRLHCLKAHSELLWHTDAPPDVYAVRMAVPLVTNPGCFFETETEKVHFPVGDHIFFMNVNCLHRVVNYGDTDRLQLMISVTDTHGITAHHRYEENENESCLA